MGIYMKSYWIYCIMQVYCLLDKGSALDYCCQFENPNICDWTADPETWQWSGNDHPDWSQAGISPFNYSSNYVFVQDGDNVNIESSTIHGISNTDTISLNYFVASNDDSLVVYFHRNDVTSLVALIRSPSQIWVINFPIPCNIHGKCCSDDKKCDGKIKVTGSSQSDIALLAIDDVQVNAGCEAASTASTKEASSTPTTSWKTSASTSVTEDTTTEPSTTTEELNTSTAASSDTSSPDSTTTQPASYSTKGANYTAATLTESQSPDTSTISTLSFSFSDTSPLFTTSIGGTSTTPSQITSTVSHTETSTTQTSSVPFTTGESTVNTTHSTMVPFPISPSDDSTKILIIMLTMITFLNTALFFLLVCRIVYKRKQLHKNI